VGCGIPCGFTLVGGDGEDFFSPGDHGPYGDFTRLGGGFCGEEGASHHGEIRRFSGVGRELLVHGADNIRERARIACSRSIEQVAVPAELLPRTSIAWSPKLSQL
jgi:hypothetical protein